MGAAICIFVMSSRGRLLRSDWIKSAELSELCNDGLLVSVVEIYLESKRSRKWLLLLPATVQAK